MKNAFSSVRLSAVESIMRDDAEEAVRNLIHLIDNIYGNNTFTSQIDGTGFLIEGIEKLRSKINTIIDEMSGKQKYLKIKNEVALIFFHLKNLESIVLKPGDLVASRIKDEFRDSLKDNFQVSSLSQLKNFSCPQDSYPKFEFHSIGEIGLSGENLRFSIFPNGIDLMQEFSNIVYLESPSYWKIKEALERTRYASKYDFLFRFKKQEGLSGVPKHFYDLVDLIKLRIKSNSQSCDCEDVKSTIENYIGGGLVVSQSGEIAFKESKSGKEIGLQITATGIVNLGVIGLLIERNILSKDSYIFIDEPEVNLHPAWQKVMVEALYELSKIGINVVIATHSIDMMKCVEGIVEDFSDGDPADHFGINQMTIDGNSVDDDISPLQRIADIKLDLGESFFEMQIKGGW